MSSIVKTNMKRFLRSTEDRDIRLNPQNNRRRTNGRNVQVDPATGNKITH